MSSAVKSSILHYLGLVYYKTQHYDLALMNFLASLQTRKTLNTANNSPVTESLFYTGASYLRLRDVKNATVNLDECMNLLEEIRPSWNFLVFVDEIVNLTDILVDMQEYERALRYNQVAFTLLETVFPHDHIKKAISYKVLGRVYSLNL